MQRKRKINRKKKEIQITVINARGIKEKSRASKQS